MLQTIALVAILDQAETNGRLAARSHAATTCIVVAALSCHADGHTGPAELARCTTHRAEQE